MSVDVKAEPSADFVRLVLDKNRRIKLRFRHAQIRKAVIAGGNRPIEDLASDPFGGWPVLLAEGHRPYLPTVTVDQASEWMDEFVRLPHPETGEERSLKELGDLLYDALKASKFITVRPLLKDKDDDEKAPDDAEGND